MLVAAAVALVVIALAAVLAARDDGGGPTTAKETAPQQSGDDGGAERGDVPGDWVAYQDPATGYTIRHPPDWTISSNGTLTDFRDPGSSTYLRVDYTNAPGPSPERAWRDFEPRFAAENANYRRIRIESTRYQDYPAAVWEFTYTAGGVPVRSIDLGFVTPTHGFALNFTARTSQWERMQPIFEAFKESFKPPQS